jgi:predicted ArsR family transcriptional regulator
MQPNRYIQLSSEEVATLAEGAKHHHKAHFRIRCETLLLSARGYKVVEIAQLFQVRPHTVRFLMDNWEQKGFVGFNMVGLNIRSGRGRKAALPLSNPALVEDLQAQIRLNPQSLEAVALAMSKKWHCTLSKGQLQRFIKKSSVTAGAASASVSKNVKTR